MWDGGGSDSHSPDRRSSAGERVSMSGGSDGDRDRDPCEGLLKRRRADPRHPRHIRWPGPGEPKATFGADLDER